MKALTAVELFLGISAHVPGGDSTMRVPEARLRITCAGVSYELYPITGESS